MPLGCAPVARGASACTHSPFDQAPRHVISARNFLGAGGYYSQISQKSPEIAARRWDSVVFGWRARRPPRVVFVLGFVSLINSLTSGKS